MRDGHLAFASTVGSLKAAGLGGELNPQALLEYLEFGFITDDAAIYQGIRKLPPATILVWERGQVVSEKLYWDCNYQPREPREF